MFIVIYPSDVDRGELKAGASIYQTRQEAHESLVGSIVDFAMNPVPEDDLSEYLHAKIYRLEEV